MNDKVSIRFEAIDASKAVTDQVKRNLTDLDKAKERGAKANDTLVSSQTKLDQSTKTIFVSQRRWNDSLAVLPPDLNAVDASVKLNTVSRKELDATTKKLEATQRKLDEALSRSEARKAEQQSRALEKAQRDQAAQADRAAREHTKLGIATAKTAAAAERHAQKQREATAQLSLSNQMMGAVVTRLTAVGAAMAAAFSVMTITRFLSGIIQADVELKKLSERVGSTVEQMSRLQFIANQEGLNSAQFQQGIRVFSDRLIEAQVEGSEAARVFGLLGFSAEQLSQMLQDPVRGIEQVADRFREAEDGANKMSFALTLFGAENTRWINILNNGSEGLKRMGDELDQLGGVTTRQAAASAEEFHREMNKLEAVSKGLGRQLATSLLPLLTELIKTFGPLAKEVADAANIIRPAFEPVFIMMSQLLIQTAANFRQLAVAAIATMDIFDKLKSLDLTGAMQVSVKAAGDIATIQLEAFRRFDALQERRNQKDQPRGPFDLNVDLNSPSGRGKGKPLPSIDRNEQQIQDQQKKLQLMILETEAERLGTVDAMRAAANERETQQYDQHQREINRIAGATAAERNSLLETAHRLHNERLLLMDKQMAEQKRRILEAGFGATAGVLQTTADAIAAFGAEGTVAYKAIATAAAVMDTARAAISAYSSTVGIPFVGPALAPAAAAAAVAFGAAQIAKINGAFADGGYTGSGGRYEPAGVVHRGEVVIPAPVVKSHGLAHFAGYFGGRMPGYAGGGFVNPIRPMSAATPTDGSVNVQIVDMSSRNEMRQALAREAQLIVVDRLNRKGNRLKA